MNDQRLNQAFINKTIQFERPRDAHGDESEEYFNILVLHQNKYKGTAVGASRLNSITEEVIPSFFNLVVWGHEHECIPYFKECESTNVSFL
jgi:double-strand break repair protein MRE11